MSFKRYVSQLIIVKYQHKTMWYVSLQNHDIDLLLLLVSGTPLQVKVPFGYPGDISLLCANIPLMPNMEFINMD